MRKKHVQVFNLNILVNSHLISISKYLNKVKFFSVRKYLKITIFNIGQNPGTSIYIFALRICHKCQETLWRLTNVLPLTQLSSSTLLAEDRPETPWLLFPSRQQTLHHENDKFERSTVKKQSKTDTELTDLCAL